MRRSVWDGVYTEAQAARGKTSYDMHCAGCYGNELEGLGFGNGPGLVGQRFVETWEGNLFSLFDMSRSPMPRAGDVTVPDDAVLDALAFMLQRNEMPAGMDELWLDALSLITLVGKDGPTPVRDLALGRLLGCLSEGPDESWVLTNATEPVKSRDGGESSETELETMKAEALGGGSYTLLDVYPSPDEHKGHKVEAKGILIRKTNSLNVTSLLDSGTSTLTHAARRPIRLLKRLAPARYPRPRSDSFMAATPSTMLDLGTTLPAFRLPDFDGRVVSDTDLAGAPGILLVFASTQCPFVRLIQQELGRFGSDYGPRSLKIVAVGSNDIVTHPHDGPDGMRTQAVEHGWTFPYLVDGDQHLALACHAACTPDLFLFDGDRRLVYRGQFDDARPGNNGTSTGRDLRAAVDLLLAGQPIPAAQTPSIGCNIKWKVGAEPAYAV